MNPKTLNNIVSFLLWTTIVVLIAGMTILNLTPPISRDALIHHLAIPKLWLQHGGFYEIPWADYSYYPMYINLLYLICLYFKNDIVPKFIHMSFGLATGSLIYFYLRQKFDKRWALMGAVIFLTTPIVIWLSTSAYIDLGMTFFTTGSILAFIKWRDLKYKQIKWILISSLCMGMAIGSKYNALIAFLIMTLILIFFYARDTGRQLAAIKYGLLFFTVSAVVASPWYIKNYLLTDNPFYPLFNGFFQSLQQQPIQETLHRQATQKIGQVSFFRLREIMYGESFWETLLIPIRMFFQGKDNSYQYFQGVLNPILIVFWPFIFLSKNNSKDKAIFSIFSIFFIFVAFFYTRKQVRYLMPIFPLLAILAVMGLKDLADRLKSETLLAFLKIHNNVKLFLRIVLLGIVVIFLSKNLLYLKNRLKIIKPAAYVMGRETRDDFLRRHLLHYDAVKFINTHLPDDAVIYQFFLGRRGYYLDRSYRNEPSFGMNTLKRLVESSADQNEFRKSVVSMGATHVLMQTKLVDNYLQDNFSPEMIARFKMLLKKHWTLVYESNDHTVWDVQG